MLLLNEQDIRKVFDMNDAIDSNIEAYKIFSSVIESVVKQQLLGRFYSWMTRTGKY